MDIADLVVDLLEQKDMCVPELVSIYLSHRGKDEDIHD